MAIITITVSGISAANEHKIGRILEAVGMRGGQKPVNEVTCTVGLNTMLLTDDEVATTVGRFVMAGFEVKVD